MLDGTQPIRPGEELPLDRLRAYLRGRLPGEDASLSAEQFPEGYSNLTYLIRRGPEEFVLRRPPFGNEVKAAHDMGREFRVLSALAPVYGAAPKPFLYCEDPEIVGAPFYVMERRTGVVIRKRAPMELVNSAETTRRLAESFIDHLADLHRLDCESIGLSGLGRPEGFIQRQVLGWTKRYEAARTEDIPEMRFAAEWLASNVPLESGATLIHNDFKYDNLLLDPADLTRILAVFDWEMATIGDPLIDLGVSLSYWVQADDPPLMQSSAFGPTMLPGSPTRSELVERYQARSGRSVQNAYYYYAYGLFKLVVIVQQIYARYVRGHTKDPRFATLDQVVRALAKRSAEAIQSRSI